MVWMGYKLYCHFEFTIASWVSDWDRYQKSLANRLFSIYTSVLASNELKSRLRAKYSYICWIFSHVALTSGYCSRELKRKSKVVCSNCIIHSLL